MRKHIAYNTVNFQPVTFRILFFRGIQTLQMRLSREACVWWTQLLRPFCRAADLLVSRNAVAPWREGQIQVDIADFVGLSQNNNNDNNNDFIVRNGKSKNLFAQLIVGPAAIEQRQVDVALSLSNVERQTG